MTALEHVERCIARIRAGGMVVMVDDEDRENEGDLVIAADHCDAAAVNFMAKEGRGLVCLALAPERVDQLQLRMMVQRDHGHMGTAFTVSIEARDGVTTGISAADRARTIKVASDERWGAADLVSPGHVFPLRAQPGGVLVRSGHTEGSVDLARLAGCRPAGVICEIMRDDGQMARMDDLERFARRHDLPIVTIAELIEYRLQREVMVEEVACAPFSSRTLGIDAASGWTLRSFRSRVEPTAYYLTLAKGDLTRPDEPVLLRAQRADLLGDVFASDTDDSGARLRAALRQIERAGRGVFLYVVAAPLDGALRASTPSGEVPGLRPRESGFREFGLGAQVLKALGVDRIRVMTNNARKIIGLEGFGIEVTGSVPLEEE
jgi:3,4-dihydroxy 2-butanone 4-phosphate synthase/GTP cyclohydrolase II